MKCFPIHIPFNIKIIPKYRCSNLRFNFHPFQLLSILIKAS